MVKALSEQAAAELALIENLQRKDLDFFEEAEGYQRLITEFDLTQEELAKRIGCSQSAIATSCGYCASTRRFGRRLFPRK